MALWIFTDEPTYREAKRLIAQAEHADQMGHPDEREGLVDAIRSLPGYPPHSIGEQIEMVLRRAPRIHVPRGTIVGRRVQ